MALPVALLVLLLALIGMWARRAEEGGVALGYGLLSLVLLSIYPPQHERLTWPLVPLVWIYAPLGLVRVTRWLGQEADRPRGAVPRIARLSGVSE